jgi:hypothetical protein
VRRVVAFIGSVLVALAMSLGILWYAKRRPVGRSLSWGEAMFAGTYVFFLMFWVYGVVPHQWLTWTQNELKWRTDALLIGPGSNAWKPLQSSPITMSKATIGDIVVVGIYGGFLVAQVALFSVWQNRGKKKAAEVETSQYGRPLVKV